MKLHLLENAIDRFVSTQLYRNDTDWYFPHSLVNEYNTHWAHPSLTELKAVYEYCLRSEYSQRWWKRENYRPREIMLQLIDADPELATIAWKDLSNEAASMEGRLSRFEYYCGELLQIHRQQHIHSVESYHHQDARMISLYLAGMYPDKYVLYPGLKDFQTFCKAVGSPGIPVVDDLMRYMKVANIVFTFLQRNEKYDALLRYRDPLQHKVKIIPLQLSYEVIVFEAERFNKHTE